MIFAFVHHDILGWRKTWVMVLYGLIPVISIPLQIFWAVTPVYLATTVSLILVYTLIHVELAERSANIEKELARKELALSESNNSLVLSQIQPHFLYNALTSIYRLCDVKPEAAKEAVSNFSKYLRGNLDSIKQTEMISFAEELKHLQAYLSLEKIRYGDYLKVEYNIEVAEFFIPPLTVQPLVENALYHGIKNKRGGGCILIRGYEDRNGLVFEIEDNGIGMDETELAAVRKKLRLEPGEELQPIGNGGFGLHNVAQRVRIYYGDQAEILVESEKNIGTCFKIYLGNRKNS